MYVFVTDEERVCVRVCVCTVCVHVHYTRYMRVSHTERVCGLYSTCAVQGEALPFDDVWVCVCVKGGGGGLGWGGWGGGGWVGVNARGCLPPTLPPPLPPPYRTHTHTHTQKSANGRA